MASVVTQDNDWTKGEDALLRLVRVLLDRLGGSATIANEELDGDYAVYMYEHGGESATFSTIKAEDGDE